jgi:chromosome segregation ATPase
MHHPSTITFTAAVVLALSASVFAAPMTKDEYKAAKDAISAQYRADKAACDAFKSNAKDICVEEAKGRESVAKAELELNYSPSPKHEYDLRIAKADAAFEVAKEKCDDASGNARDICRKEAKSQHVAARAEAQLSETKSENNTEARKKMDSAKANADDKNAAAQKDATADKQEAAYVLAKEKCDAYAGDVKANCIKDAKTKFGKN